MAIVRRRGLQTEQFARRRRKKLIFVAILFLIAVASIISALFLFFRAAFVQIQSVEISGPVGVNGGQLSLVPAAAVQTDVEKDLADSQGYLFSKNTLFFYPKSAIRAELMQKYPAIASINFEPEGDFLGFGSDMTLHIIITERVPFALACTDTSSCFYMDSSGFVYAPAAFATSSAYVEYEVTPQSVTASSSISASGSMSAPYLFAITPGKLIADEASFETAKSIVSFISDMNLNVTADTIGSDAFGSTDTIFINDNSDDASGTPLTTEIYFNQSEPIDTALNYFSEFWQNEATSSDTAFQYIDMRYGKDIVYKLYPQDNAKDAKTDE